MQPNAPQPNPPQHDGPSQAAVPPKPDAGASAQPATPPSGQTLSSKDVAPGAEVFGKDGKKVGTVQETYRDCFLMEKGAVFHHDYYVPYNYVARTTNELVYLTLTSDEADHRDWSKPPSPSTRGARATSPERTPAYGNYGEAGVSDTIQDATNRGEVLSDRNDPALPWSRDEWSPTSP